MNQEVQVAGQQATALQTQDNSRLILDNGSMKSMMELASFMSKATVTLPDAYRGNPANCLAVVMQAVQWDMNPFSVAQKTHFVHGTIGYEAQLVAAAINASSAVTGSFHFEWYGPWEKILGKFKELESNNLDDNGKKKKYRVPNWTVADETGLGVRVWNTLRGETEPRELDLLLAQAAVRNSTLWADDPRQQLAYLAQKRWARLYCPGVILGVYTPDEAEQMEPKEINPRPRTGTEAAQAARAGGGQTIDQEQTERRGGLITALEAFAKKGPVIFTAEWRKVSRGDRQLIGETEYERLKQVAMENEPPPESKDPFVEEMERAEKKDGQ